MSVAHSLKQREWSCNIFATDRQESQLFSRKRRSDFATHRSDSQNTVQQDSYRSTGSGGFDRKNEGDLFLYEGAKTKGCMTPGFGSGSKRVKDSLSM